MNTINLYDLKYAIDNDPRVRNTDIDSQYMSDDTLIANIKDEKTRTEPKATSPSTSQKATRTLSSTASTKKETGTP